MRHGSLFSGIGGFDLASEWMGWENVFQVEIDKFCQKVLAKNFPNVKRYGDIKEFDSTEWRGRVDIISGGFPCQPFSHAGKRKGQADDRYLWPEMLRVIGEIKPSFVVGENVAGLISMENGRILDGILSDLANGGYTTEQFIIPACAVGTWHRRDRIWIIAYNTVNRLEKRRMARYDNKEGFTARNSFDVSNNKKQRIQGIGGIRKQGTKENAGQELSMCSSDGNGTSPDWWQSEPSVGRVVNEIPNRVDRLKGLGNAIVPQVAYEIFKAIEKYENLTNQ